MDGAEFVERVKQQAIDATLAEFMRDLESPPIFAAQSDPSRLSRITDPETRTRLRDRMERLTAECQRRTTWFNSLSDEGREVVTGLLRKSSELTALNAMTLIDGLDGKIEGVFEIVYVVGDERHIVNPEDSETLRNLLSDVIHRDRSHEEKS